MQYKDLDISTRIILKVIFAVLLLAVLWLVRDVIVVLLLAVILASALDPLVDYLKQHRVPRGVSVVAVYISVLGLFGLLFYSIIPFLVQQFKVLLANLPGYVQVFNNRFGDYFGNPQDLLGQVLANFTGAGGNVVSSTFGLLDSVIGIISVLVISFYLLAEQDGMKRFVSSFVPPLQHNFTFGLLEKVQKKIGLWILGQVIASVVMFLITWIGLSVLHVQYALVLAVIAGVLEVIPFMGPILSAIPAIFFALLQGGWGLAFIVAVLYFILHELEGYVLIPKIMEKTIGVSPLVILLAILIGFKLDGVVGIVVAVPLVGAFNVVAEEFWPGKII